MEALSKATIELKNSFDQLEALLLQNQKEIYLSGLKGSFFAYIISKLALSIPRCFLVITSDNDLAEEVCSEIQFFLSQGKGLCKPVLFFPSWETLPYDTINPHPEKVISRLETLYHLQKSGEDPYPIVVLPLRALMQHCIPSDDLKKAVVSVQFQDEINRDHLVERLVAGGYRNVSLVEERGEFSVRGGILDVFPPLYFHPIRLELFGDRVESIRQFNPATQRSVSNLESFSIIPVSEIILDNPSKKRALESIETLQSKGEIPSSLGKKFKEKFSQNSQFPGISFLLEFFYKQLSTLPHYLPEDSIVWCYGVPDFTGEITAFFDAVTQNLSASRAEGKVSSLGSNLYLTPDETREALTPFTKIWTESLDVFSPEKNNLTFSTSDNKDIYRQIMERRTRIRPLAKLVQTFEEWLNEYYIIILVTHSDNQKKRLQELLGNYGLTLQ
ncbi:MAG: hypothetical protein JRJ08_03765, partial [Deltaproteobacteria bacterium]|nr:hypothetical protein [Deltaproteobacteria bacterium]